MSRRGVACVTSSNSAPPLVVHKKSISKEVKVMDYHGNLFPGLNDGHDQAWIENESFNEHAYRFLDFLKPRVETASTQTRTPLGFAMASCTSTIMKAMASFEIGKPYPNITPPASESGQFLVTSDSLELRLLYRNATPSEVHAIQHGTAAFALAYHEELIWFLYRFHPAIAWSEAPFSQHLVREQHRGIPQPQTGDKHYLLNVVLADADTAVILAIRQITLTSEMSQTLHNMYNQQSQTLPVSQHVYNYRAEHLQRRYPTTEALLATAEATQ